jgi:flagellar motor switch protein FliM
MTTSIAKNLSREKLQQLLAGAGPRKQQDSSQIQAVEYNWHRPYYFSSAQLKKLDDFKKKLTAAIAEKFVALCRSNFDVKITSITQYFAEELIAQTIGGKLQDYYLVFGADPARPCGLVGIPQQTAAVWVTQLLGGTETGKKEEARNLSQLEESFLLDITSAVVEAFSSSHNTFKFKPAKNFARGQFPLELQNIEEVCKIIFSVEKTEPKSASEAYILILCKELESAVKQNAQQSAKLSAEDVPKTIAEHLQKMTVSVTARFAGTTLPFGELLNLQPGDILMLDKKITEPLELMIEGRIMFKGLPAKSAGKQAVVITELCRNAPQKEG